MESGSRSSLHSFARDTAIANAVENTRERRRARRRAYLKKYFRLLQGEHLTAFTEKERAQ